MDGLSRIVPLAGLRAAAANFHWPGVGRQGVRLYYSIQIPIQLLARQFGDLLTCADQ